MKLSDHHHIRDYAKNHVILLLLSLINPIK